MLENIRWSWDPNLFFDNKLFQVDSCASVDKVTIDDKKKLGAGWLENAFLSLERQETIMFQGCMFTRNDCTYFHSRTFLLWNTSRLHDSMSLWPSWRNKLHKTLLKKSCLPTEKYSISFSVFCCASCPSCSWILPWHRDQTSLCLQGAG